MDRCRPMRGGFACRYKAKHLYDCVVVGTIMEKLIIIGAGCAGYTAAIYAARANLDPLVIEGYQTGGQLMLTIDVENFPGFPEGIQGPQLVQHMRKQAERFGTRFITKDATGFHVDEDGFTIAVGDETYQATSVIVATGASARWLGLESEKAYQGKGVTTCATCDGAFFKDQEVIVVGGGDSAMEEALFLTKFCTKVTIVHRRDSFRASKIMQTRALKHEKIDVVWNKEIIEVLGDGKVVTGVRLKDTETGDESEFSTDGVFLAIGHVPNTKIFKGVLDLDDAGYLTTDRDMRTNVPGVFGAGDVQDVIYRQAITASGSGCKAAIQAERYLAQKND